MERINNSPTLPPRVPTGYKGTFGKVCVIGGSCGDYPMIGAPARRSCLSAWRVHNFFMVTLA